MDELLVLKASVLSDPAVGRFAQSDTIVPGGGQGWDRYAYVNNNPLRYVDASGHCILLEEDSNGLCVHINNKGNFRIIQVVRGGSVFKNRVEVALANYLLSGESRFLNTIPGNTQPLPLEYSLVAAAANLGYKTGYGEIDPSIILMALLFSPGRDLDDIISMNNVEFLAWARHKFPNNSAYSVEDATKIWFRLKAAGVTPVLDPPHPGSQWNIWHINVRGMSIHIPVVPEFVPPP